MVCEQLRVAVITERARTLLKRAGLNTQMTQSGMSSGEMTGIPCFNFISVRVSVHFDMGLCYTFSKQSKANARRQKFGGRVTGARTRQKRFLLLQRNVSRS